MKIPLHIPIVTLFLFSCSLDKGEQVDISTDLSDLSARSNPIQTFEYNPENDTLIVGSLGTKIFIPANSLVFDNGEQATSKVTLSLKEVYSISDMILNGLSTTTNEKLLETSGMINLKASSSGKTLNLKPGSPVRIQFKNVASAPFMRTYLGQVDSTGVHWQLDAKNVYDTVKFDEPTEYIVALEYGADVVFSGTVTYGIVGNDTIELKRAEFEGDLIGADTIAYSYDPPFYEIHSTELNWINCDFFINSDDNIGVLTNKLDKAKSRNFLIFHDYYSIMSSWEVEKGNSVFRNIPRGSKVTAIGIAKKDSEYYLAVRDATLEEENQQIMLDYKKSSLEKISIQLEELE